MIVFAAARLVKFGLILTGLVKYRLNEITKQIFMSLAGTVNSLSYHRQSGRKEDVNLTNPRLRKNKRQLSLP